MWIFGKKKKNTEPYSVMCPICAHIVLHPFDYDRRKEMVYNKLFRHLLADHKPEEMLARLLTEQTIVKEWGTE